MSPFSVGITAAAILLGFLFAGFWWSLDREIGFPQGQRHFKPGYALLLLSIALVGYFGLIAPLRLAARAEPTLRLPYWGVTLGLIAVLGYMLTEYAHYSIFRKPIYSTKLEWLFFLGTIVSVLITFIVLAS